MIAGTQAQDQADNQFDVARQRARVGLFMWAQIVLRARQARPNSKIEEPSLKKTKPE